MRHDADKINLCIIIFDHIVIIRNHSLPFAHYFVLIFFSVLYSLLFCTFKLFLGYLLLLLLLIIACLITHSPDTLDFSKLTLHQAKKQEMESQIHLLELERNLEKERQKLSELRKVHYKMAGESEGWDQEVIL